MTARFIAFEGGEAAGKSTQTERLAGRLGALLTREPGGTALGAAINGKSKGDTVTYTAPTGKEFSVEIVDAEPYRS